MIRLCVGISKLTPSWQSVFDQIGIRYEEIDFSKSLSAYYSCLVINNPHTNDEIKRISTFLKKESGGVLLLNSNTHQFGTDRTPSKLSVNMSDLFVKKVSQFYSKTGLLFTFDFDLDHEYSKNTAKRKRFPYKTGNHPDEIVSSLDRESLRITIELLLREMHYHRKLPYVSKWHSPSKKPFFAFRIDTDFGDKKSLKELYTVAEHFQIPMTWFLHVQAHEEWLDFFHTFEHQEIALHGYEHGTSTSYEHVLNNIEKGKQLMIDAGFAPSGFCVPYSIWNDALGDVLERFDFKYSSEFTLAYDTLPFYPIHKSVQHATLQIPIHPICTGSLNRIKVTEKEMEEYFGMILDQKISSFQNVIFYHHPMQPGLDIWKRIFKKVNEVGLDKLTFSEIADFWKDRINSKIEVFFDIEKSTLRCDSSDTNLILNVSVNSKEFYLIEASKANRPLNSFDSIPCPKKIAFPEATQKELRGNRIHLLKTSILDWKNRRTL